MEDFTYPYEQYEHRPPRYNRPGRPGPYQVAALKRLDEARDAELDEWHGVYFSDGTEAGGA